MYCVFSPALPPFYKDKGFSQEVGYNSLIVDSFGGLITQRIEGLEGVFEVLVNFKH